MLTYEIYAIKYASQPGALRCDSFLGQARDRRPCPEAYYFWLLRGGGHNILIDTGFDHETASRRGRVCERDAAEALDKIGISPAEISHIILTHLHNDHAGTLKYFQNAHVHLQELDLRFVTGRAMMFPYFKSTFECDQIVEVLRVLHQGRASIYDGDAEVLDGVAVHLVGGHTPGLQFVRVRTPRGDVVLASDVALFYDHFEQSICHPTVFNTDDMLRGYLRIKELSAGPDHIIPGHDPQVLDFYPAAGIGLEGVVARLDLPPIVSRRATGMQAA